MKLLLILFIELSISIKTFGQDQILRKTDNLIAEMNAKKYRKVITLTERYDLVHLDDNDSLGKVTMYWIEKKGSYGKDVMEYNFGSTKKIVTYYHLDEGLIAIVEELFAEDDYQSIKYYFANGKLYKVYDHLGQDRIDLVNQEELYRRIRRLYTADWIIK